MRCRTLEIDARTSRPARHGAGDRPRASRRSRTAGARVAAPAPQRAGRPPAEPAASPSPAAEDRRDPRRRARRRRAFDGAAAARGAAGEGFVFGRYDIFHRLTPTAAPVLSVASLRDRAPSTRDDMDGTDFAGLRCSPCCRARCRRSRRSTSWSSRRGARAAPGRRAAGRARRAAEPCSASTSCARKCSSSSAAGGDAGH